MNQRLEAAARAGDIDSVYSLLKENAHVLEYIEEVPFITTPLHIAASLGHLHFAMEMMRLKPSFARKSNEEGYSPIHSALLNGHSQMVLRLIDVDRDLVRVQGREGKTPLHLAIENGMLDLLAEFLSVCPTSIHDLTIRKETALHIAVKNGKVEALKILFGWLDLVGKDFSNLINDEGNTILHVAVSTNQTEMVSLIINKVHINATNLAGLTALDILLLQDQTQQADDSDMNLIRRLLLQGGALKASSLPNYVPTLAESLQRKMSWHEKWIICNYREKLNMSNEDRNIIVVVSVLFATTNYQALLDSLSESTWSSNIGHLFSSINNIAFFVSTIQIFLHLPSGCADLKLVLLLVILSMLIGRHLCPFHLMTMAFFLLVFYYSKLPVVLYNFFPIAAHKKSFENKRSIFKYCSSFH